MPTTLKLSEIKLDPEIQQRVRIDEAKVAEYAEVIDELPPVTVYSDGSTYWLAGGFHRWHAHNKATRTKILCEIVQGTKRDAILYAVGDNSGHGLPRSNADKRKAVATLLSDPEWGRKSTEWVAERAKVSWGTVDAVRKELTPASEPEKRTGKDGKERKSRNESRKPVDQASGPVATPARSAVDDSVEWVRDDQRPVDPPSGPAKPVPELSGKLGGLVRAFDDAMQSAGLRKLKEHQDWLDATSALMKRLKSMGVS
jgi:hypothetical protein